MTRELVGSKRGTYARGLLASPVLRLESEEGEVADGRIRVVERRKGEDFTIKDVGVGRAQVDLELVGHDRGGDGDGGGDEDSALLGADTTEDVGGVVLRLQLAARQELGGITVGDQSGGAATLLGEPCGRVEGRAEVGGFTLHGALGAVAEDLVGGSTGLERGGEGGSGREGKEDEGEGGAHHDRWNGEKKGGGVRR